jgi:hypothetical protein
LLHHHPFFGAMIARLNQHIRHEPKIFTREMGMTERPAARNADNRASTDAPIKSATASIAPRSRALRRGHPVEMAGFSVIKPTRWMIKHMCWMTHHVCFATEHASWMTHHVCFATEHASWMTHHMG